MPWEKGIVGICSEIQIFLIHMCNNVHSEKKRTNETKFTFSMEIKL